MPSKGQILSNPDTGDIYEFLKTAKDSNGQRVVVVSSPFSVMIKSRLFNLF